jgi:hypothetical protein
MKDIYLTLGAGNPGMDQKEPEQFTKFGNKFHKKIGSARTDMEDNHNCNPKGELHKNTETTKFEVISRIEQDGSKKKRDVYVRYIIRESE